MIIYILGIAGGKWYDQTGSGSNYLCLPETPEYDDYQAGPSIKRAYVFSAEYSTHEFPPFTHLQNQDVPCAVCRAVNRGSMMMIPALMTCPAGWNQEYYGYLMSHQVDFAPTEFVCMDRNPEVRPDTGADKNGAIFVPVEGRCHAGNLPCGSDSYQDGAELTCVVCTK